MSKKRPWWKVVLFPFVYPSVMGLYYVIIGMDRFRWWWRKRKTRELYIKVIRRGEAR